MKRILIFGAGRSATFTIAYLLNHAQASGLAITIADAQPDNLEAVRQAFPGAHTVATDVADPETRRNLVAAHDIVISLLPATFHILLAYDCVACGVHLITPSYISPEMQALNDEAIAKKIIILNETGLDPGIDHMSTMNIVHRLKESGAEIRSYKSYCGGLIPANDLDNPFRYKLSWSPYNVIRAGQDGGLCRISNRFHYVPYHRLFAEAQKVSTGQEDFESYFNRNSLHYISLYGLQECQTFLRGTLRYPGFCQKWNLMVNLGLTSDKIPVELPGSLSWQQYLESFIPESLATDPEAFWGHDAGLGDAIKWLVADPESAIRTNATPAENLQTLLEQKWKLKAGDKDRVVMLHELEYALAGKNYRLKSLMDLEGEDARNTAMAKTVGLPLALAALLMAQNKINTYGVIMPTVKEVYRPMLAALEQEGIGFTETVEEIK